LDLLQVLYQLGLCKVGLPISACASLFLFLLTRDFLWQHNNLILLGSLAETWYRLLLYCIVDWWRVFE